jgi:hypothetical protein
MFERRLPKIPRPPQVESIQRRDDDELERRARAVLQQSRQIREILTELRPHIANPFADLLEHDDDDLP